jgi:hypothetical protein
MDEQRGGSAAVKGTTPSLPEVIRRAVEAGLADAHVAIPAKVTRVDLAKGQLDVQPLVKDLRELEDGNIEAVSVPVVTNVPVVWPGAGGFRLTFPIAAGDIVLLVFSDRSLDVWLAKGGEVDPADPRRHALSDAVAIPGIRPFSAPWTGAASDGATLGKDGGTQVKVTNGVIELDGADEPVALADSIETLLTQIRTWLGSHTHPTPVGSSGPPAQAGSLPAIGELGSSVAKVKR